MVIKNQNPSQSSSEGLSDSETDNTDNSVVENEVVDNQNQETEADSSNAQADSKKSEEAEHKTLLDVVKDVVKKSEEDGKKDETETTDSEETSDEGESSTPKEEKSDKKDPEISEFTKEELEKEKPSTRKRIERLISDRREATELADTYKPAAESFNQIDGFMREHGIAPEEAAEAFTIMAMVKNNPQEALKRMKAHVDNIAQHTGEILPADLKQKVTDGTLDEDTAKELSVARATAARERDIRLNIQNKVGEDKKVEQTQALNQELANTLNNWQVSKGKTDPDYSKKHELLKVYIQAAIGTNGRPTNPAQVTAIADEAYSKVTAELNRVIPQQKLQPKKKIVTRNVSGPAPKVAPSNTLEIIRAAVGKR